MKAAMRGRFGWLWILAGFMVGFGALAETRAMIVAGVALMLLVIVARRFDVRSNGVSR
jgi:hypothetical protein